MRETWYVLEDGRVVDPCECSAGVSGKLVHKSGVAVAMRGDAYSSRGVDAQEERAKASVDTKPSKAPVGKGKAMKPDDQDGGYKTRNTKAE